MSKKNVLITSLSVKGTEIASELCSFGMHAVTTRDTKLEKIPDDTQVVIIDNPTGELEEAVKSVTQKFDLNLKKFVITELEECMTLKKDGVLYISSEMDKKSLIEIVRFCTSTPHETENLIKRMLLSLGFFPNLRGYNYIVDAVKIILENPEAIHNMNQTVYPAIAKIYNRSKVSVERSIRSAVETAYDRDIPHRFNDFFGYKTMRPTNVEFISLCVEKIRMNIN